MQSPEQLLQRLSGRLHPLGWRKTQADTAYRFRCPYCQHSADTPAHKHKGYIHPDQGRPGRFRFKCHNCHEHKTLLDFVKEQAPDLLLPPAAPSETVSESSESSSSGQKVTKLPRGQSVSDNLWRSRHMPRHLYRGNPRTIKSNNEVRD